MYCLGMLGSRDRGFESHAMLGCLVCVCVYTVFVLSYIYVEALRRADHSSKSPTDWKMIKIKKIQPRHRKGIRGTD
jgi:hypothetical protein